MSFDEPHANPSRYLTSSYIYRKALIRKHQLHNTITEYLAKTRHRGQTSVLEKGGVPQGWVVDIQFADELDELLVDDLYELREAMEKNEELDGSERT
jgi:tubulin--tyrosine ligase